MSSWKLRGAAGCRTESPHVLRVVPERQRSFKGERASCRCLSIRFSHPVLSASLCTSGPPDSMLQAAFSKSSRVSPGRRWMKLLHPQQIECALTAAPVRVDVVIQIQF